MSPNKSDYASLAKNFEIDLSNVAKAMDESSLNWFVVAGWALDLKGWFFPSMEEVLNNQPAESDFIRKCWETDCNDFEVALPLMSDSQREWIHSMLTRFTPEIPWLKRF